MRAGDAIVYGEIKGNDTIFSLNQSAQDIASGNRFNVKSVLCITLVVIDSGTIPKLNSRP